MADVYNKYNKIVSIKRLKKTEHYCDKVVTTAYLLAFDNKSFTSNKNN